MTGTALNENEGIIVQIIGPVMDVEFPHGSLPEIYDALNIYSDKDEKTTAEAERLFAKMIANKKGVEAW